MSVSSVGIEGWNCIYTIHGHKHPWQQGSWGQHGAHLRPTGPRWAPCWPHELCYLGPLFQEVGGAEMKLSVFCHFFTECSQTSWSFHEQYIIVTSHECHSGEKYWQLNSLFNSPFNSPFKPTSKKSSISCITIGIDYDTVCTGVVGTAILHSTSWYVMSQSTGHEPRARRKPLVFTSKVA